MILLAALTYAALLPVTEADPRPAGVRTVGAGQLCLIVDGSLHEGRSFGARAVDEINHCIVVQPDETNISSLCPSRG